MATGPCGRNCAMASEGGAVDADVVIIGAGIAGGLIAHRLAGAGLKVIILEAGPEVTRADLHTRFQEQRSYTPVALDPQSDFAPTTHPVDPDAYLINVGPARYNALMTKAVGGTTWHWTGRCARFADEDFRLRSTFGVGEDWPITYADIEPYYCQAEQELGVTASSSHPSQARRSKTPPMQDFAWPYLHTRLREKLAPYGMIVETDAYARNAREFDGRPACRGNNTCWPLCPIGALYSGIVHVDKARDLGVEVRSRSLVTRLETNGGTSIARARYRRPDGSLGEIQARLFVIAANGMETPKILLASASESLPAGLANSSDQVGRNFMDQATVVTRLVSQEPLFPGRGPVSFVQLRQPDDRSFRKNRALTNLSIENKMSVDEIAGDLRREGLAGDALDKELRFRAMRAFTLFSAAEILPDPNSRIVLDWQRRDSAGQPRMRVAFAVPDYTARGLDFAEGVHREFMEKVGVVRHDGFKGTYFGHHPAGATRMGNDPRRSVVDRACRSHDHPNLFMAGSAVFPTLGGTDEPTLTIAALALRTADAILAAPR